MSVQHEILGLKANLAQTKKQVLELIAEVEVQDKKIEWLKWGCKNALMVLKRLCNKCPNPCSSPEIRTEDCKTLMLIGNINQALKGDTK